MSWYPRKPLVNSIEKIYVILYIVYIFTLYIILLDLFFNFISCPIPQVVVERITQQYIIQYDQIAYFMISETLYITIQFIRTLSIKYIVYRICDLWPMTESERQFIDECINYFNSVQIYHKIQNIVQKRLLFKFKMYF